MKRPRPSDVRKVAMLGLAAAGLGAAPAPVRATSVATWEGRAAGGGV